MRAAFALDPAVLHWNHGSYGACPRAALAAQAAVRAELESATMRYFVQRLEPAVAAARAALGEVLHDGVDFPLGVHVNPLGGLVENPK